MEKTPKMETGGREKQPGIIEPNVTDAFQTEKHAQHTIVVLLNAILLPSSSSSTKAHQYVFNIKSADATTHMRADARTTRYK